MSNTKIWLRKIPGVLTAFMVIALGATLANLLWMILTPPTAVAEASTLVTKKLSSSTSQKQNYGKLIADQHIFGTIPKAAPKVVKKAPPPPKPKPVAKKLNLTLHGIIASKTGGFAMISYNRKTQEVYKQGEALPKQEEGKERELEGVIVKSVGEKQVIIDNNGTEQILELPSLDLENTAKNTTAKAPTRNTRRKLVPAAKKAVTPEAVNTADEGQASSLAELREQALENPDILMSVITPSIVRKDGAVTGIRVYPSRNRKMFRELGFRNGDIITQVNDIVIDDPSRGLEIFQQLSDFSSLSITVIRGGNEQVLTPQF